MTSAQSRRTAAWARRRSRGPTTGSRRRIGTAHATAYEAGATHQLAATHTTHSRPANRIPRQTSTQRMRVKHKGITAQRWAGAVGRGRGGYLGLGAASLLTRSDGGLQDVVGASQLVREAAVVLSPAAAAATLRHALRQVGAALRKACTRHGDGTGVWTLRECTVMRGRERGATRDNGKAAHQRSYSWGRQQRRGPG